MSGSASRTASSKHGRSQPERPRLGASVDGEARQETALLTVRPRRITRPRSLVLRARCRRSSVVRCRWRRRVESPHDDHRTTSHSKRLEALTDVPSSSDRLDYLNSVVDCSVRFPTSNCTVRWSAILQDKTRAQTRIVQKTTAHAVFWRGLDCSVEQVIT